ncbi:MAG: PKD domain-containing protein [Proteobacteria bacterium]|nr:PKD domain-containing protein [Pseudomonadota bacterium]
MNTIRKSTLALAVVAACCAAGSAAAAGSLMTVARPTFMQHGDALMGALPQNQQIRFSMSLQMRDRAGLDAFIAGMKNHPGQVMSTAQFMARHAPTQAQVDQVVNWLKGQGFSNIDIAPNHLLVTASGNAGLVGRAFNTSMAQFKTHDGRIAFGNTTEAMIPAELQSRVLGVVGLQDVNMGHTFFRVAKPQGGAHTLAVTGHSPLDFDTIYGASSAATGSGVTVGIFTQGKITQSITDLNTFTANNGLPTVTTQTVQTGASSTDASGVGEWDLDSQDIIGMTGGVAKIIWYNTTSLSEANMDSNFNTIVSANAAKIINVSIGGCETGANYTTSDNIFAQGVAQGQTFSISTGDSGADECGNGGTTPSWPANSQYVVAVAGTTLNATTGSSATWSSETVWKDSGGSQSKYEPKPSWQTLWTGTYRGVADVAFDGDPNSGAKVIVSGATQQIGGTSLSAPLFAGEWARVIATKGTSVGFAGPIIYQLPASAFHDITSGSNGISAKVGYDLASGRGSMILSTALANWPGGGGGGGNNPPTANFTYKVSGLKVNFTDKSTDSDGTIASYSWTFGDGKTSTTKSPQHTYKTAGTYSVTETVTDNGGATGSKTQSVKVQ